MKSVIFDNLHRRPHLTFQLSKNLHQVARLSNGALTNAQIRQKRSQMFDHEKKRQLNMIPRLEKIEVQYQGVPEDATLILPHIMLPSTSQRCCVTGLPWPSSMATSGTCTDL
jgi:hypothetical protein